MQPKHFGRAFRYRIEGETDFYQDVGGVTREIYMLYSEALFSPGSGLFCINSGSDVKYQADPQSGTRQETLDYYRFTGRLMGKAVLDGYYISAHLVTPMYKLLLKQSVTIDDIQSIDTEVYTSLKWMLSNSVDGLMFETFSIEEKDPTAFWPPEEGASNKDPTKVVHEFIPNGATTSVTDSNKKQYVQLRVEWMAYKRCQKQVDAFLGGFWEVVPQCEKVLQVLNVHELEMLMCGTQEVNVEDWRANTQYAGDYNDSSKIVKWWWEALASLPNELRQKLLQFATGTSIVPIGGFKALQSVPGKNCPFTIAVDPTSNCKLPRAHTCFNRVDLPEYNSKAELIKNLKLVLENEIFGFGMEE